MIIQSTKRANEPCCRFSSRLPCEPVRTTGSKRNGKLDPPAGSTVQLRRLHTVNLLRRDAKATSLPPLPSRSKLLPQWISASHLDPRAAWSISLSLRLRVCYDRVPRGRRPGYQGLRFHTKVARRTMRSFAIVNGDAS